MTQLINTLIKTSNKAIQQNDQFCDIFKLILNSVIEHDLLVEAGKGKDNCILDFADLKDQMQNNINSNLSRFVLSDLNSDKSKNPFKDILKEIEITDINSVKELKKRAIELLNVYSAPALHQSYGGQYLIKSDLNSDTNEILNEMGVKYGYVLADLKHRTINVAWQDEDKNEDKSDIKSDGNE